MHRLPVILCVCVRFCVCVAARATKDQGSSWDRNTLRPLHTLRGEYLHWAIFSSQDTRCV